MSTKISYRYDKITIGEEVIMYPTYRTRIVAMEDRKLHLGSAFYPIEEDSVFDITSAYFVSIAPTLPIDYFSEGTEANIISSPIIVKDNNTIVLNTIYGYFILSRESFIDNVDSKIRPL